MAAAGVDRYELAIDFGTSNTTAVARVGGAQRTITFTEGAASMPSGVLLIDGSWHVGVRAQRQWRVRPQGYEPAPKRRVGTDDALSLGGRDVSPVEMAAAVFEEVLRAARRETGLADPDRVVLTHPQRWSATQVGELRAALERAGYRGEIVTSVSEPVAAARRYEEDGSGASDGPVLVFDFGGGTCDVAVLGPATDGLRPVLAADGDSALGGTDFDARLFEWVLAQIEERGRRDVVQELRSRGSAARLTLLDSVRTVKEDLSDHESGIVPVVVGAFDEAFLVQKTVYEAQIAPDVDRAVLLVRRVLERAHVRPGALAALYLTGGSSLTPSVVAAVERAAGVRARPFKNPKLVVAEGALRAAALGNESAVEPPIDDVPKDTDEERRRAEEERRAAEERRAEEERLRRQEELERQRRRRRVALIIAAAVVGLLVLSGITFGAVRTIAGGLVHPVPAPTTDVPEPDPVTTTDAPAPDPTTDDPDPATQAADVQCWDGSTVAAGDTCPALTGQQAVEWAYGDLDSSHPADCEQVTPDASDTTVVTEVRCTWSDLPHTSEYDYEFASTTDAKAYFADLVKNKYPSAKEEDQSVKTDSSRTRIGGFWSGRSGHGSGGHSYDDDYNVYDRIPFGSWIFTDLSAGGTSGQEDTAYGRLYLRSDGSISSALQNAG